MKTLIHIGWLLACVLMLLCAWVAGDSPAGADSGQLGRSLQWIGETLGGEGSKSADTRQLAMAVTYSSAGLMVAAACFRIALVDLTGRQ